MGDLANKDRNGNTRQRCSSVGNGHQGASVVRCNIDVVGQEAAEHTADRGDSNGHQGNGSSTVTSNVAQSQQTAHGNERRDQGSGLPGNRGVDLLASP